MDPLFLHIYTFFSLLWHLNAHIHTDKDARKGAMRVWNKGGLWWLEKGYGRKKIIPATTTTTVLNRWLELHNTDTRCYFFFFLLYSMLSWCRTTSFINVVEQTGRKYNIIVAVAAAVERDEIEIEFGLHVKWAKGEVGRKERHCGQRKRCAGGDRNSKFRCCCAPEILQYEHVNSF